jgi:7-cyano-7-deazaguanine synthase
MVAAPSRVGRRGQPRRLIRQTAMHTPPAATIGLLFSGGLDSAILLGHLLQTGARVQPFYIRSNLYWQDHELPAAWRFLQAMRSDSGPPCGDVNDLVVLELPLDDLYHDHWSITGRDTPGAETRDDAVFLPGRNPLLVIKAALWCGLNQIDSLALASLTTNPFADSDERFFAAYETALNHAIDGHDECQAVQLVRPFRHLTKEDVMRTGREFPLQLTFSCIQPTGGLHCGRCNKCAERQAAFASVDLQDTTRYATYLVT